MVALLLAANIINLGADLGAIVAVPLMAVIMVMARQKRAAPAGLAVDRSDGGRRRRDVRDLVALSIPPLHRAGRRRGLPPFAPRCVPLAA
jgi:hypothetical protein